MESDGIGIAEEAPHPGKLAKKQAQKNAAVASVQCEPMGVSLMSSNQGMNILSEPYTYYNLTSEELSAKGNGGRRQMYNYISANQDIVTIQTPDDTYQPDKVSNNVTVDTLQQKRMDEIHKTSAANSPFVPKI